MKYYVDLKIHISIQRSTGGIYSPEGKKNVQSHLIVVEAAKFSSPLTPEVLLPAHTWGGGCFHWQSESICLNNLLFPGWCFLNDLRLNAAEDATKRATAEGGGDLTMEAVHSLVLWSGELSDGCSPLRCGSDLARHLLLKWAFAQLPLRSKVQLKLGESREASGEPACSEAFTLGAGMAWPRRPLSKAPHRSPWLHKRENSQHLWAASWVFLSRYRNSCASLQQRCKPVINTALFTYGYKVFMPRIP